MKRRRTASTEMRISKSPATGSSNRPPIYPRASGESVTQVQPGVLLVDGCEVVVSKKGQTAAPESGSSLPMKELSLNEAGCTLQDVDFFGKLPDEILLSIFKYVWQPVHCWDLAKVCKRFFILQACNQLQKRCNHMSGNYPCSGSRKAPRLVNRCNGSSQSLKLKKVESEWRLGMDLLGSCKRHTHLLEIKDCTHISPRGYQLITGFASNLKSIRLESCMTMDDANLDVILDRCPSLRSIRLSVVPKLDLRNVEKKAPRLQELHVHGCPSVTATTVLSLLNGCPKLRSLGLSRVGFSKDWDESKIVQGAPWRLQDLELSNTLAVTDGFLQALAGRLTNLRKLDLSNCPSLSDVGLKVAIASCGSGLQRLVVTRCPGISDDSVQALAGVAAKLQDISLAGTNVGDDGLKALVDAKIALSRLRILSVACCQGVTDAGLQHLASKSRSLASFKTLDVQSCPKVSLLGLESLRNSMACDWKIVTNKM